MNQLQPNPSLLAAAKALLLLELDQEGSTADHDEIQFALATLRGAVQQDQPPTIAGAFPASALLVPPLGSRVQL